MLLYNVLVGDNMDENLKREIILENYQNPKNRGLIVNDDYKTVKTNSKTCIDQIDLQIKVEGNIIKDIRFDGEACAICTSSTSIMIKTLIGKTMDEAKIIINNFGAMIEEKSFDEDLLNEAIVYKDISKQPNRKNCALMTWKGTLKFIEENKK